VIIGLRTVELFIPHAQSLKEKRQVLRRIKDRVKSKLNVSYSEIDHQDKWQRSCLGFVTIANRRVDIDRRLDSIIRIIEADDRVVVVEMEQEYL